MTLDEITILCCILIIVTAAAYVTLAILRKR